MNQQMTGYPSIDKPWLKYYTAEQINAEIPHVTAYEYLKSQTADLLDTSAIDSAFGCYTYRELFAMTDAVAAALWQMNMRKGDIILEMLPVMPHETFLFYAVDAVGAALAPLAPMYPTEEVCKAIRKFDAKLFFVSDLLLTPEMEEAVYQQTDVEHIICIGFGGNQQREQRTLSWEAFLAQGEGVTVPGGQREPEDLLFLASTGGSTGEPKSVMLNDNCFNAAVHQFINSPLDYQPADRWTRLWPIFSASAAVVNHHLPLCTGMHMLLRNFPLNMADFDQMIIADKSQHLILIPQLMDVMEKSELLKNEDLSFIKTAGCGGLGITRQFEERVYAFFKDHNINTFLGYGWGSTESSACGASRTSFATTSIGSAGAPMVNNIMSVFDPETNTELTYDELGELCLCSPNTMMGYYGDPELTSQVLRKHPDGRIWLHTGDLGTISKDGIVTVKGRMSRVIFVFPTAKIYPQALETAVSKVDGVKEVVFCEIPDQEHDGFYLPVCFIVPDGTCTAEEVQSNVHNYCRDAFPEYAWPKGIYFKNHLPLTKVGKPDIRALEAELLAQQS